VLFESLRVVALLLAPVTPFVAEAIYQRLDGKSLSVHMLDWPTAQAERLRPDLERSMEIVQDLVEIVSKERQKGGRKLRWPLKQIALKNPSPEAAKALETLRGIFLEQANAKALAVLQASEEFPGMALVAKPDPAAIGKAYKVLQPKIVKLLEARPAEEIKKALDKGHLQLGVEGQIVTIEPSMVRFEKAMPAEVVRVPTDYGELYLDLRVTPELQAEAYAREVIRRIQQMRKEIDLEVDDFILTVVKTSKDLASALESQKDFMARETRSRKLTFTDGPVEAEYVVEWNDVDGHSVTIGVTPLHMSEALRDFTRIPGITVAKAVALFDAGYKSLAALRAATKQEIAAIDGLQPADAVRILDALAAKKAIDVSCPTCGGSIGASTRRCLRCGEPVTTKGSQELASPPSGGAVQGRAPSAPSRPAFEEDAAQLLKDSSSYLVLEATPEEALRLFQLAQATGKRGLVITRTFPQKVRERLGGAETLILWLSNVGKEEDTVRPKDLEKLSLAVEQFLARERGVILLDAIEYLVTNNNFITVLRLVQSIRDQVAINNGVFLISVNPSALDPHQLTLLQKEVDQVIPGPASPPA
jgi:isoleucyl-tRNA synthetase